MTEVNSRSAIPVYIGIRYNHRIQIPVIDTFNGEVDIVRQFGIESQRSLPSLRHAKILTQDGGAAGDRRRTGCTNQIQHLALIHREFEFLWNFVSCSPIRGLTHTRVTNCGNEPYERHTAYEETCTTSENVFTVASHIPVETNTR